MCSNAYGVQNPQMKSFANRDKSLKLDELFMESGAENESVFEESSVKSFIPSLFNDTNEIASLPHPKTQSKKLNDLLGCAYDYLGSKYAFGAQGLAEAKTDCSLYTQNVFKRVGIELPRSSAEQSRLGAFVSKENLQVGDLLFFRTYKREPSHVGIYLGDNKMIHASFRGRKVMIDDISKAYYSKRYLFAKRHEL